MKIHGHNDKNILLLNQDHYSEFIEYAPMLEEAPESKISQSHEVPEETFPELVVGRKTILIPLVQTMKDYILLHYKRGIATELCRQIIDGEVGTGYDIDDIQVIPQASTCQLHKMLFWRKSSTAIIADIDVGIDLFLKDGVVDDTVKASFHVTLNIDMDEGEILECNIYLSPEDVLHIPGLGFDGILGHSPIALARNAIGLNIAAEEYGGKFFSNGANPSGILTTPGVIKDPEKVRSAWSKAYSGANVHKVAVLEENPHYERISIPNNEAQFLETRKFQIEEICRIFQVPPHLVASLDRATFSNIESQSISFVVHTIRPWLVRWEQALNRSLFSEKERSDYFVSFVVDGLLRGDYKSRMEGYAIAIQNGFMSPNDVRSLENLNPIPAELGGDLYAMNGNMLPLKDVGAYANKTKTKEEPE